MESDAVATVVVPEKKTETKRKRQPRYNVILLDDNDHTYEYVIRMLGQIFGYGEQKAFLLATEVDTSGRVILLTTTREHAELKQEQIHAFGADRLIPRCKGSMTSVIEPAPGE
jgi:ATP-dependent Clp protease adaptor protein ClpS